MRKKFILLLLLLVVMLSITNTASAASETKEVFTLDQSYHMAVSILFDKEKPIVTFTAPDGAVIKGSSLRSDSGDDWVQYYIPNAAPGTWMITYDKLSNTKFEINYSSYMDTISISDFSFGEINGNYLPVSFNVTSVSEQNYQYKVFAVITDENDSVIGERLLMEGLADLNQVISNDINIGDLSDYNNYKLRLDVWQKYGVEEAYDSKVAAGSFAVTGHSGGEVSPDFHSEVNLTDGKLAIDWSETAQQGEYLIAIFNDAVSKSEPFFSTEVTDGRTQVEALFDLNAESLRIEFTYNSYGQNYLTRTKTIPITGNPVEINPITEEFTNSSQAYIEYAAPKEVKAEVMVNDKADTINLNGNGKFSIELPETYNTVEINYSLDDLLIKYIVDFQFTVDSIPPLLRLPENKTAIRVQESEYVLAGVTDPGVVLKIAGSDVTINKDGTFLYTISLSDGENMIKVTSTDVAGNVTAQDVIISKVDEIVSNTTNEDSKHIVVKYMPLILSFMVSIFLLAAILLVRRGFGKTTNRFLFILRAIRNIIVILGVLLLCSEGYCVWKYMKLRNMSSGEEYYALAKDSIDKAYQVLQDMKFYVQLLKYIGVAIGVCALLIVILSITIRLIKNRKDKNNIVLEQSSVTEISESNNLSVSESPTSQIEYICRNCGAKYDKPINFCEKCGEKM